MLFATKLTGAVVIALFASAGSIGGIMKESTSPHLPRTWAAMQTSVRAVASTGCPSFDIAVESYRAAQPRYDCVPIWDNVGFVGKDEVIEQQGDFSIVVSQVKMRDGSVLYTVRELATDLD